MDNANGFESLDERRKRMLGVGGDPSNSSSNSGAVDNTNQGYVPLEERRKQIAQQNQQQQHQPKPTQPQPTQQPTIKPNTKSPQQSLVDRLKAALGGTAHMINNAVQGPINQVEGFLSNASKAVDNAVQPQNPVTKDLPVTMPQVNMDPVKKKAEAAYLKFPSLFDNPDKISQQEGTMTPETLQHMAYRVKSNIKDDPIGASIAQTNDFLTYHPEALKTLAYIQDGMGVVGDAIDKKIGGTAAGKDVEQVGSGIVNSATTTYLGSSKTIQNTLDTSLQKPVTMDQKVFNTVGQVLGGVASFIAGGEILKGAQLGKAAMPILFGTLGMTSAPPDTSFSKRLTIGAINALGGKYFAEAGDTSAFSAQAIKAFAKVQGINTVMTGLSDLLENKKPKDIATDLATSGVVLSLFHVVGTAHGLFNKEVTDLQNGKVPAPEQQPGPEQPGQNPIPNTAVAQPEGSELTHVNDLQSYKTEPQQSLDNATSYIQKSTNGEMAARKPLDVITLSDGKKVIVDGNATYQSAKASGYTHLPTAEYQRENLGLTKDATDEQIVSAVKQKQQLEPQVKQLVASAKEADPAFKSKVDQIGQSLGLDVKHADIKSPDSILRKTMVEYDGDLSKMKDVNRATVIVSDPDQLKQVVEKAKEQFGSVGEVKDKFNNKGYNAANISVPLENGTTAEIQVTTPEMLAAKTKLGGHDLYKQVRVKAGDWETAEKEMNQLYAEADAATARRLNSSSDTSTPMDSALKGGNALPEDVSPNTSLPSESTLTKVPSTSKNRGNLESAITDTVPQSDVNKQGVNVTFQSKETRAKQETFTKALDTIRTSSTDEKDLMQKVNDLVGKTLDNSNGDRATLMGMRTALNKEMMESVGDHGTYKKNYAMLKYMQGSDSDNAHYLSSLEDHIGLLDDVIRSRSMDDFARTFGQVPSDLPAASEKPGMFDEHNVQMMHGGLGPNPNIDKFVQQDVIPYAKETLTGMKKAFNEVRAWLSPTSTVPKSALDTVMSKKGDMEQSQFRAEQATKDIKNMWDKQNDKSRFDFMHQVETGETVPEKFQPIADFYRERLDDAHKQINRYKDVPFLENFFPHFWEKPEDMQKFFATMASKRPFEGTKSFLKQRVFSTIQEGIDLGYKPVSTNPEELMQIYEQNVRKFTMAQEIKNDLIAKGFWKFVRSGDDVPPGFSPINDNIAKVYFPPSITEVKVGESEIKKMIEAGQYHAQDDVARIINNYLSTDLIRDTAIGKGLMNMKNTMNAFELGFSAFHGTMETLDSIITHGSIGFSKIFNEGKVFSGLKDIITSPVAPVKYFRGGQKFYNGDPELIKIEQDLFTGGATLANKQYFKNTVYDTFLQRVREGNVAGAAVRTPLAVTEAAMRPLMSYYIPRLKIGAFRHLFSSELERNSQAIQDGKMTREELARKTWSNVENRMGELNYDNLFWNRTLKASMMLGVRAVGWNLGTVREIGGGVFADAPQQAIKMIKLQRPELTPKMAYTLNLLFTTAAVGSVYQYLHTGKAPQNLTDMFYPQNGGTNQNGNPTRVQFPTYLKDMYSASHDPVKMVENKMAPEISTILDLLNNKDYYGNVIHNTNDNLPDQTKQVAAYMINSLTPFSIQSVQQQAKGHATIPEQLENFLGIQKAPIDTMQTDKEKRLYQAAQDQMGIKGPQTPEQQHTAQLKVEARKDILDGKRLRDSAAFMELVHNGTIKTRLQAENFVAGAKLTPDQRLFKGLSKDKQKQVLQMK